MGFRSSRDNRDDDAGDGVDGSKIGRGSAPDTSSTISQTAPLRSPPSSQSRSGQQPVTETLDIERAERHYGMEIPDLETLQRLQNHEKASGKRVHEWIAEGMPIGTMGIISEMEAFRQRQQERPPEVPTAIERHNEYSLQRNRRAARETEPPGDTQVSDRVREVISSSGQALDSDVQEAMEQRMGGSLGDVRIHTGPKAASACDSIDARAFTVGNHVAFNSGEYDPSTLEGQHVLAHELAHVRQQTGGAISMLPQEDVPLEIDPDPELEREAEATAQRVMHGGRIGVQRLFWTDVHVQRPTLQQQLQGAIQRAEKGEQSGTEDHEILPEWAEALIAGATLGETGMEDGVFATQYRSHPMYLLGWVGLSMVPVVDIGADIRDAVQNFATGDYLDVGLDLAGLLPFFVSDAPKAISAIRKWTMASGNARQAFRVLDGAGITKQIPADWLPRYYRAFGFEEAAKLLDDLSRETVGAAVRAGKVDVIVEALRNGVPKEVLEQLVSKLHGIDTITAKTIQELVTNSGSLDAFYRTADELVVTGKRYGVEIEVRYPEDGAGLLSRHGIEGLSKGTAGEKIADKHIRQQIGEKIGPDEDVSEYLYKGFDPDAVSDAGPDLIYRDPETGDVVVTETKFLSDTGNFGKGNLGKTKDNDVTQMDGRWIDNVIKEKRGVDGTTKSVMQKARARGKLQKEFIVIQNRPVDGKTITRSISSDIGADSVTLYKIGEQR